MTIEGSDGKIRDVREAQGVAPPEKTIKSGEADKADVSSLRKSNEPIPIKKAAEPSQPALAYPKPFAEQADFPTIGPAKTEQMQQVEDVMGEMKMVAHLDQILSQIVTNTSNLSTNAAVQSRMEIHKEAILKGFNNSIDTALEMIQLAMRSGSESVAAPNSSQIRGSPNAPNNIGGGDGSPPAKDDNVGLMSFLMKMATVLSEMRTAANEGVMQSTSANQKVTELRQKVQQIQNSITEKNIQKTQESSKLTMAMQVLGPLIGVSLGIVTVLSLGTATPALVVAITVATTLISTGITVADSFGGVVSKEISKSMSGLDAIGEQAELVKGIIIIAAIAAVALLARGAASQAISNTATAETEKKVAAKMAEAGSTGVVSEIERQGILQAQKAGIQYATRQSLVLAVMSMAGSTGALTGISEGATKNIQDPGVKAAVSIAIMTGFVLVAGAAAFAKAPKGYVPSKMFGTAMMEKLQIVAKSIQAGSQVASAAVHGIKADVVMRQKEFEAALQLLSAMGQVMDAHASRTTDTSHEINDTVKLLSDVFARIQREELQDIASISRAI